MPRSEGRFMGLHGLLTAHWDHEPVAKLGAPASLPASFLAHSATRRQGCRRSQFRFMGSLHLQLWTRIGTMNHAVRAASQSFSTEFWRTQRPVELEVSVSSNTLR